LKEQLNSLAERSAPRGFDDVFAAASRRADTVDVVDLTDDEPKHRRTRRPYMSLVAAAGVAALLVVGSLAISSFVGSGGAGSPDAAVRQLADAVTHGDPLAAADVLAPDEVRSLHGTLSDAEQKAQELAIVQTASAPLSGLNLSVDDLKLDTTQLAPGYAKVTIDGGTFSASTEKAKFSALMQKVLRDYTDNSTQVDLASLTQSLNNLPTFVMTVKEGDSWYVSAAYTIFEYVREYNNITTAADFGSGVHNESTLGADTPDDAVQEALRALQANDFTKLFSLAPPNEIPVYDYRDVLNQLIDKNGSKTDFTIDSLSTTSQVNGDTAEVTLTGSGKNANGDSWSWRDGCFTETDQGTRNVMNTDCVSGGGDNGLFFPGGVTTNANPPSTIQAVRIDGRWFVSASGTVLDVVDSIVRHVDRPSLYTALHVAQELPPTGTLTLGQPQHFAANDYSIRVLSFDGHAGEKLLGQSTSTQSDSPSGAVGIYAPDGSAVSSDGILSGQAATLPADGTYKILERSLDSNAVDITMWDEANAPASAKQTNPNGQQCTTSIYGDSGCYASSSETLGGSSATSPSGETYACIPTGSATAAVTPTFDAAGKPVCPSGYDAFDEGGPNGFKPGTCPPPSSASPSKTVTCSAAVPLG
jgi:hypothetical protein